MAKPIDQLALSPQFCFNQTALRDFLRISRSTIDDSIAQNLNALRNPASFDPSSTSSRSVKPLAHQKLDTSSCNTFKERVLFPSWQVRSDVLNYCTSVATSPDKDDPDSILQALQSAEAGEHLVDRLDPYNNRYLPKESRTESLAALIRNEIGVERIIRSRTWGMIEERCGLASQGPGEAFDEWRSQQGRSG
ncbi:hypothetical protein EJ05DRAFT_496750 [Pseudovirgaria hyperparasitica]|uniref:Caffeine-induced death protein Cid2 n=1 Tax=Pseudovirgaria hyperparasitica TaxID=470096 RepID=A0A6A6WJX3_9PEZI|nr:uncharacterized protein EJ05DRAFT_496750 [Pseudovirgaria hyperparasitica]KAF2761861.1 hypothetical protein EJ05DRAFT_496750 [Pseudovirgaria hyperparasitica]